MPDIHFECPRCNQSIDAPEELANQLIDCPTCKETIEVPTRSSPAKPEVSAARPPPLPFSTGSSGPPPILPTVPQLKEKSASRTVWIIIASVVGGYVILLAIFLLLISTKSSSPDTIETELKAHLLRFRGSGHGASYELIESEKNALVQYYRENKASLTNYTSELDEICADLDSAIVPWGDEVPEAEFQRRADVAQRALDKIAILIERLSHDDKRLERAKNWKASQDVERAKRAR